MRFLDNAMTVSADQSRLDQLPETGVEALPAQNPAARSPGEGSTHPSRSLFFLLLLAFLTLAAFALLVRGTHNDLWLDELISLRIAHTVKTPWQVFTAVHSDNNQYLNTLYLYLLPEDDNAPALRFFSVLCGVALVGAGYWLLARRSRLEGLMLSGLLAFSYPLIHIGSEARGYAGALLGSVLAFAALERWLAGEKPSFFLGLVYGVASVFAILSHLTSCLVLLPLSVASLLIVVNRPKRLRWISVWFALNLLPGCVFAALYFLDLRFVVPMGGDPMSVGHGLGRLLALGIGWPRTDSITIWIPMLPLIGLMVWQLAADHKSGATIPTLIAPIYLVPLVAVALVRPQFFSPRYLLVILPFIYVYIAILLARLTGSRIGRLALAMLLTLFLAGQAFRYRAFLEVGRGQPGAALEYINNHTTGWEISLGSNQDFRSAVELSYFAPRVLKDRHLLFYVSADDRRFVKPEWYVMHEEGSDSPGPAFLAQSGRPVWGRAAYFGASELSGQAWTLYRRLPD